MVPDFSRGKAIVFVHASGSNGHSWHHQINALGARHSPIAMDMPAHGRSDGVVGFETVAQYTDFLAAFMDALKLKSAVIAGRSLGGMVALDFAIRKRRGESKRLARPKICRSMHIERRTKGRTDDIVHARVICVIGEVEAFRGKQQVRVFADFERAAETQV